MLIFRGVFGMRVLSVPATVAMLGLVGSLAAAPAHAATPAVAQPAHAVTPPVARPAHVAMPAVAQPARAVTPDTVPPGEAEASSARATAPARARHAAPLAPPGEAGAVPATRPGAEELRPLRAHTIRLGAAAESGQLRVRRERTARFSAYAVSWAYRAGMAVPEVTGRVHRDGRWTDWQRLDVDAGPGRPGPRWGGSLVWAGPSDGIEVRLDGAPVRDVEVELIDPGVAPGDAEAAHLGTTTGSREARPASIGGAETHPASIGGAETHPAATGGAEARPAATGGGEARPAATGGAEAPPGATSGAEALHGTVTGEKRAARPKIRSRKAWGADEDKMKWDPRYADTLRAIVLHHTATGNDYRPGDVPKILRSIYHYQAVKLEWGDIGYHVMLDRFGRLWEGRYGGLDKPVVGGHAGGFNTGTAGIGMLGSYTGTEVPDEVVDAAAQYVAWRFDGDVDPRGSTKLTGGPSSKYDHKVTIRVRRVFPHSRTSATACPGDEGRAALKPVRTKAAKYRE